MRDQKNQNNNHAADGTKRQFNEQRIVTKEADREVSSLYEKHQRGRLRLNPEYQRKFVWDQKQASRLIESILLGVPLPMIYLAEQADGKEEVIDGQQRLTSIFFFLDGRFAAQSSFKLIGVNKEVNGKSFKELDEESQDRIRGFSIRTVTFTKESDVDLKYMIFERLNSGSVKLNHQELRNCTCWGPYNDLLKDMATENDFVKLLGFAEDAGDRKMRDVELVLRFAAFYHSGYRGYKAPMKNFLNRDMERHRHIDQHDANDLKASFRNALGLVKTMLGDKAFRRFIRGRGEDCRDGKWEIQKYNVALYDVLMGCFARRAKPEIMPHLDALREALIDIMTSEEDFLNSIDRYTDGTRQVMYRFSRWEETIEKIIGLPHREPRCFSVKLKQEMFSKDPTCLLCGQQIQAIDDAALDHIHQYWLGGKTIPQNARLSHRYCNAARPRQS
ncbi:MAG: DUF262 domain-containing protein [Polyangia bacterium]